VEPKRELLLACRGFVERLKKQRSNEPTAPSLQAWKQLGFATANAGAPAELVESVAYPLMPFADGMMLFGSEKFRARLLGNVAKLISWCEAEGQGNTPADELIDKHKGKRTSKSKRGAPQREDPVADHRLVQDWQAAKREGATRDGFCGGRGIKLQDLIDAQNREKYRRQRDAE
jgi:hypothetical protein